MSDLVVNYACKSLAYLIDQGVASFSGVYVATPDFDWNRKPDPNDPVGKKVVRSTPFAAIVLINDQTPPFSIGNILYEQVIDVQVHICAQTYSQLQNLTADMKQVIKSATNSSSGSVGVTLYDFDTPSGMFYAIAGTMMTELGRSDYFGPDTKAEDDNRKFTSITPLTMSAYKDATATLLENKGRVSITDT